MRVLVTGGQGYIGSVLVPLLVARGHQVRVLDTEEFGRHCPPMVEQIRGDIRDSAEHEEWFDGVEAICHLAGLSNDPTSDFRPTYAVDVNVMGTAALAATAVECGISRFTFASSASIYDRSDTSDCPELQHEGSKVIPMGSYSVTKFQAEVVLHDLAQQYPKFKPTILRQATVYGRSPRMRFDLVVNTMTRAAISNGVIQVHGAKNTWRPLISVQHVALAHAQAIEAYLSVAGGRTFNVGEGNFTIYGVAFNAAETIRKFGLPVDIDVIPAPSDRRARNYRMSTLEWYAVFGQFPNHIDSEVAGIVQSWKGRPDLFDPIYENMAWMGAKA